jgi:hypothetical protein
MPPFVPVPAPVPGSSATHPESRILNPESWGCSTPAPPPPPRLLRSCCDSETAPPARSRVKLLGNPLCSNGITTVAPHPAGEAHGVNYGPPLDATPPPQAWRRPMIPDATHARSRTTGSIEHRHTGAITDTHPLRKQTPLPAPRQRHPGREAGPQSQGSPRVPETAWPPEVGPVPNVWMGDHRVAVPRGRPLRAASLTAAEATPRPLPPTPCWPGPAGRKA